MQNAGTLTFNKMERRADRALGVVLWAKHVKNYAVGVILFALLSQLLHSLVDSLSADEKLNALSDEQVNELMPTLREIHAHLVDMMDHNTMCLLRRKVLFKGSIVGIEESAEDLSDLIEDLSLSCNKNFRAVVADCVQTISTAQSPEPVGRM